MASALSAPPIKRAGEVGAAAAQGGGDAGLVGGDEAAHHRHLALARSAGSSFSCGALFDERVLRNRLLKLRIGDDDLARVHVGGVDAALAEGRGDNAAGDALADS